MRCGTTIKVSKSQLLYASDPYRSTWWCRLVRQLTRFTATSYTRSSGQLQREEILSLWEWFDIEQDYQRDTAERQGNLLCDIFYIPHVAREDR
jgi:hypothetical protein